MASPRLASFGDDSLSAGQIVGGRSRAARPLDDVALAHRARPVVGEPPVDAGLVELVAARQATQRVALLRVAHADGARRRVDESLVGVGL